METNFIADIIKKNWCRERTDKYKYKWTFYEDIEGLNDNQLAELICLLLECIEVRVSDEEFKNIITSLKNDEAYTLEDIINKDIIINKDFLFKFLVCVTFSEHKIDDILLYPGEMRYRKLQEISKAIGVEQNMLSKIDSNWHNNVRDKIFG